MKDECQGDGGDKKGTESGEGDLGNQYVFQVDCGGDKRVDLKVGNKQRDEIEGHQVSNPAEDAESNEVDRQKEEINYGADEKVNKGDGQCG